jgi:hypothetical protein
MSLQRHKRIGLLFFNEYICMPDIQFPNGTTWGGLVNGQEFEILHTNLTWVQTRLIQNGYGMFLQGYCDYVPLNVRVRI